MNEPELALKTISEIALLIESGAISPVDLTNSMLERIDRLDPSLNSYNLVLHKQALADAKAAEAEISRGGYRGKLHGVPIAIKDLLDTKGITTTCSSPLFADRIPTSDATVVARLKAAGAVILGKTNMTEFALYGYNPALKVPRNPWNPDFWPGVSSSGSGVATAARLAFGAVGTDTGGSIRFPAAANSVVGLKPTYGRVSRHGAFPLAQSLDHIGPLTNSVADAAIMLGAMAGYDPLDPTTFSASPEDFLLATARSLEGFKLGIDEKYIVSNSEPDVSEAVLAAVEIFQALGAQVVPVEVSRLTELSPLWGMVVAAEAASAHAKYFPRNRDKYGPIFTDLLEGSTGVDPVALAAAYTLAREIKGYFQHVMAGVDALVCPSMPVLPPSIQDVTPYDVMPPEASVPLLCYAVPFNFSGNPTISLPCGFSGAGHPISLQLVGKMRGESSIIGAAHAYEKATSWHNEWPSAALNQP